MRLALVEGTQRTQAGREVDEAFHRAIARPQAKGLRTGFMRTVHPVDVFTASGRLFLGRRLAFDLDWDRMTALMDRLIRGFFWKVKNRRLPDGYGTDWHPVTTVPNISPEKERNQRIISKGPFLDFGDGAFRVRAISSHNESDLAFARAGALGAEVIPPRHHGGGWPNHWELWLRDPDGYKVVLASPDGTADGGWRPG